MIWFFLTLSSFFSIIIIWAILSFTYSCWMLHPLIRIYFILNKQERTFLKLYYKYLNTLEVFRSSQFSCWARYRFKNNKFNNTDLDYMLYDYVDYFYNDLSYFWKHNIMKYIENYVLMKFVRLEKKKEIINLKNLHYEKIMKDINELNKIISKQPNIKTNKLEADFQHFLDLMNKKFKLIDEINKETEYFKNKNRI